MHEPIRRRYLRHRNAPVPARACGRLARIRQMRHALFHALREHLSETGAARSTVESSVQATSLLTGINAAWPAIRPIVKLDHSLQAVEGRAR